MSGFVLLVFLTLLLFFGLQRKSQSAPLSPKRGSDASASIESGNSVDGTQASIPRRFRRTSRNNSDDATELEGRESERQRRNGVFEKSAEILDSNGAAPVLRYLDSLVSLRNLADTDQDRDKAIPSFSDHGSVDSASSDSGELPSREARLRKNKAIPSFSDHGSVDSASLDSGELPSKEARLRKNKSVARRVFKVMSVGKAPAVQSNGAAPEGRYLDGTVSLTDRGGAINSISEHGSVASGSSSSGDLRSHRPKVRKNQSVVRRVLRRMSIGKAPLVQYASVYFNGRHLGDITFAKPNPMVDEVRLILLTTFPDLAHSSFSFWYSKDVAAAVDLEDEGATRINDCLADNVLCVNDAEFMNKDLEISDFHIADDELRDISPGAEGVLRCCFRLLEDAVGVQANEKANPALPKLAKSGAQFIKLVARATVDSRTTKEKPGSPNIKWYFVELLLHRIEELLVLCSSRQKIAEWWFYRKDVNALLDAIRRTQDAFRSSPNLPINHPLFHFKLPKLGASVAYLVDVLNTVEPHQFTGKKHGEDREMLARYLGVTEGHLRSEILTKRKGIFLDKSEESPLFRPRNSPDKDDKASSARIGSKELKETLAPLFESQDAYIDQNVMEFCPGTREWALDEFDDWINDPRTSNRSFIFMAPPGSGKSFFISNLVRTRSRHILAYHFCRHDDSRSRDSKTMLLSLIYQLSLQSPHFSKRIRVLLAEKGLTRKQLLGPNSSVKMIFADLLARPLSEIPVPSTERFVVVIDGLDEAKDGDDGKNEILDTIQGMFHRLPGWISFCFTTRQKLAILKKLRKFNARMISPTLDQNETDFKLFFDVECRKRHTSVCFGDAELPSLLAFNADESFLFCKLIVLKLKDCKSVNRFDECTMFKLENLLRAECLEICANSPALFWKAVQLCMVAVEPLAIEVLCDFLGCAMGSLLDLLSRCQSFFTEKNSVIRFVHQVSKDWLLVELGNTDHNISRSVPNISLSGSSKKSTLLLMDTGDEVSICHNFFARQVKRLMFNDDDMSEEIDQMTRDYLLQHGVHHLALGNMFAEVKELILNPAWLLENAADLDGIIQSCELLCDVDQVIALLARAVSLSGEASRQDPRQLIGQLVGRLIALTGDRHSDSAVRECMVNFLNDLRAHDYGFQWWCPVGPTWDQAKQAYLRTMMGHTHSIQSAAWHDDGRRCASGSWDNDIRVWDTVTGHCSDVLSGHKDTVWAIDWEPNGRRIASASLDRSVRIWNADAGCCESVLLGHEDCVWDVRWSLDAKAIASASKDKTIRIWDASNGSCTRVLSGHEGLIYSVSWEGGVNSRVCSGSTDNQVRIWNTQSGECESILAGHKDWIRSVDWCKTGHHILSASADQTVRVWDVDTFECVHVLMGHSDTVWSVSISQDGHYAVSGSSDGKVRVWECATGRAVQVLEGHKGAVWSVAFCPDSKRVVSGSADKSLIIWDASVGVQREAVSGHVQPIWCIDATKDGSKIVSGSADKTARLWDVRSGLCEKVFSGHTGPVFAIKLSANGKLLATASSDNTAALYRIKTGERQLQLIGHTGAVWCVAWSVDDSIIFTGSKDTTVRAWDTFTGKCKFQLKGHTADVKAISVSLDGKRLASGSTDKTIRIWDLETNSCGPVLARQDAGCLCLDWHPKVKDLLVAGYISGSVCVWNTSTRERETDFLPGHARRTNAVSWSPDGETIVSVSSDKEIRIWSMQDNHCVKKILASTVGIFGVIWTARYIMCCGADKSIRLFNPINTRCESVLAGDDRSSLGILDIALSKDGKHAVSGSRRGVIQIWNAETGVCEKTLSGHTNWVHSVFFDEGGTRVLSRSDDGTTRLWDVASGECLMVNEDEDMTPQGFVAVPKTALRSLSGPGKEGQPVGVLCDKVRVEKGKACGWIGKQMYFFELMGKQPIK